MSAIATEMILFDYNLLSQHISAPTGYPQAGHDINHLSMVLSMPQRIRCFVTV
jgi:hypothetical protein